MKAREAVDRVASAVARNKTRIIDLDRKAYFDTVTYAIVLQKMVCRVADSEVLRPLTALSSRCS